MSDYSTQIDMAHRMISDKGMEVTITRRTSGSYDPATASVVVDELTQTAPAIITEHGTMNEESLLEENDLLLLIAAKNIIKPLPSDKVTVNDDVYTIQAGVRTIGPSGDAIAYRVHLKR